MKRRKKGDDDDDGVDLDDLDDEDEDDLDGDDDDDDENGGNAWSRMEPQRKVLIISAVAGSLVLTSVIGGAAWFLLGTDEPEATASAPKVLADGSVALPDGAQPVEAPGGSDGGGGGLSDKISQMAKGMTRERIVDGVSSSQVAIQNVGKGALSGSAGLPDPDQARIVPFAMSGAFSGIRPLPEAEPLSRVPDPALVEKLGSDRVLPVVARNGTRPMDAYARPIAEVDPAIPRIAILIRGIGLSRAASLAAIKSLPPEISLVIDPYARDPQDWVIRARLAGHEVFVGLPMESNEFPFEDAGPLGLNANVQVADNLAALDNLMSLVPGYVGFVSKYGSKFGVAEGQLRPVFETLRDRGLMFVDAGESGTGAMTRVAAELELPRASVNIKLDTVPTADEVASKLLRFGALARSQSVALAMGRAYPKTIQELQSWLVQQGPDKLRLVPVSAIADLQVIQ